MKHVYRRVEGRIHNIKCEINVAEHCNLSCRGCSHLSPVVPKAFVDPAEVLADLTTLARHYRVDVVRLLGGEPLLHPDLLAVIAAVRASGIGEQVCVVTNGLLLLRMEPAFWQAVDRVDISMYPGRSPTAAQLTKVKELARTHAVDLRPIRVDKFRESYSEMRNDDPRLVARIHSSCKIVHDFRCHTVAHGVFYRCPQSYFIPKILDDGADGGPHVDGLTIRDEDGFGAQLLEYLNSTTPPQSCANCLGSAGRQFDHVQIRRGEFRDAQNRPVAEMFSRRQSHPLLWVRGKKRLKT
jgi:organic radical activating enzyme